MKGRCIVAASVAVATLLGVEVGTAFAQAPFATLHLGETRSYPSAELPAGRTVVCIGNGKRLTTTVPPHSKIVQMAASMKATWVRGLSLQIRGIGHGMYVISCI